MTDALRLLALAALTCAATLAACTPEIPDPVPYEAHISLKADGQYIRDKFVGAELWQGKKKLGKVEFENAAVSLVKWTGPRAKLRDALKGGYVLKLKGPCGDTSIPLEGPPDRWRSLDDDGVAESIHNLKAMNIFLDVKEYEEHTLLVDWGEAGVSSFKIGKQKYKAPEKSFRVSLTACDKAPKVRVDGKTIGKLSLSAKAHLISLDPGRCHRFSSVSYGTGGSGGSFPSVGSQGRAVTALPAVPTYQFESAPSSVSTHQSVKGFTSTELVVVPCR